MKWMVAIVLLALAAPAGAQELPKPTEAGQKALDDLIGRCIAAGGLHSRRGLLGLGPVRLSVADAAKLKVAVGADKAALTPRCAMLWSPGGPRCLRIRSHPSSPCCGPWARWPTTVAPWLSPPSSKPSARRQGSPHCPFACTPKQPGGLQT